MSAVVFVMQYQRTSTLSSYDDDDKCNSSSSLDPNIVGDQLPRQQNSLPKFSIRDFVFASRKEDVGKNWPFSKKSLQLCLKHGVKDLLPHFQQLDSLHNNSVGRSFVVDNDAALPVFRVSTLDNNTSLPLNNQLTSNSTVSGSVDQRKVAQHYLRLESRGEEKDLEPITSVPCQSALELASTYKLPAENSDEQEVAVRDSDANLLSSSSFKRNRLVVKVGTKTDHKLKEGTSMSDLVAPCELMASKVCPVCGTFSSSSNTTLNAHIDQCLFMNTSDRMENLKMTKPRIKPRKIRLMSDICATAPCCTLEDLDRRNGRIWVSDATDLQPEATDQVAGVKRQRVLSRQIHGSVGDSAVYIDADGTKIRILSSFDEAPSHLKSKTDLEMKKPAKGDKPRKSFAPNKRECLAKDYKNHKQVLRTKEFCRKSISIKADGDNVVDCTVEASQREGKHVAPVSKTSEINKLGDSGMLKKWVQSKRTVFSKRNISIRRCDHSVHVVEQTRELTADSDQSCLGGSHMLSDIMKHSSVSENYISSSKSSLKAGEISYEACDGDSWCSTKRNRLDGRLSRSPKYTSMDSACEDAIENHVDVAEETGRSFHPRGTFRGLHVFSSEGNKSFSSRKGIYLSSSSLDLAQQPMADKNNSSPTSSRCHLNGVGEEMVQWPDEVRPSDLVQDKNHNSPKKSADSALGHCNQADERSIVCLDGVTDSSHGCIGVLQTEKTNDGDSPSILVIGRAVEKDADLHEFPSRYDTQQCTEEYHEQSFVAERSALRFEPSPSGPGHDMNYADSVVKVGSDRSFLVIDPIPIPGPPGSDLPSPRDMESEVLKVNLSLPTSQVECFYHQKDMTDGDSVASPGSARTIISNFTEAVFDWKISEPCRGSRPADERGLQERDNSVSSTLDNTRHEEKTMGCSQSVTLDVDSAQGGMMCYSNRPFIPTVNQPCCSWKEGISWDTDLRYEDHRKLPPCPVTIPALERQMITNEKRITDRSTREVAACGANLPTPIECDSPTPSVSPSTLVFRLMGKNLTITHNDKSTQAWVQPGFDNCPSRQPSTISGV